MSAQNRGSTAEWATVLTSLLLGVVSLVLAVAAYRLAEEQNRTAEEQKLVALFDTAQTCVAYREHVLELASEYGQTAEQVHDLLYREVDFVFVETGCGPISDLVKLAQNRRPSG